MPSPESLQDGSGSTWLRTIGVIVLSAMTGIGGGIGQSFLLSDRERPSGSSAEDFRVREELAALRTRMDGLQGLAAEREARFRTIEGRVDALLYELRNRK